VGLTKPKTPRNPFYDKWIDTPRLLKENLLQLAEKGDELAIQGLAKIKEWEDNPSEDLPGTTGDTYPDSYDYGAPQVLHL
jgi:hypothetical protein